MIKFNGINHLAMATRDLDKTIRFWRDLLRPFGINHCFLRLLMVNILTHLELMQQFVKMLAIR